MSNIPGAFKGPVLKLLMIVYVMRSDDKNEKNYEFVQIIGSQYIDKIFKQF